MVSFQLLRNCQIRKVKKTSGAGALYTRSEMARSGCHDWIRVLIFYVKFEMAYYRPVKLLISPGY